jgi:hypothetical protein
MTSDQNELCGRVGHDAPFPCLLRKSHDGLCEGLFGAFKPFPTQAEKRAVLEAEYEAAVGDAFQKMVEAADRLGEIYEMCADDLSLNGNLGDNPLFQPAYGGFENLGYAIVRIAGRNTFAAKRAQAILKAEEDANEPNGGRLLRAGGLKEEVE